MRWGRVLAGGFLAETLLFAAVVPGFIMQNQTVVIWIAVIGSPITAGLVAYWLGRRFTTQFVLQGALIGLVATLIYVAISWGQEVPGIYTLAHGLKILGGAVGGMLAGRRVAAGAPAPLRT